MLLGRNPGPIARGSTLSELDAAPIPAGLPSDLLIRRPDILAAEQQLVASNALIGSARALFFPRITLTGLFGFASASLGNLFTGPARTWSFTGDVAGPIYTGGGLTAAVDQAEARKDQSLANYELTIQNAFRDVEDALADVRNSRELQATLERRVATLRRGVELARERYENGYSDYLEVLDASFSFDGVIGAFALSKNLYVIAIGLGIGAMYVRSMTIMLVEKGTLAQYRFLEHGAFYAILILSVIMYAQAIVHVPEVLTGLGGATIIGIALWSSIRYNRDVAAGHPDAG